MDFTVFPLHGDIDGVCRLSHRPRLLSAKQILLVKAGHVATLVGIDEDKAVAPAGLPEIIFFSF